MSCITNTWPAVPLPAPMPMVAQDFISPEMVAASRAGIISSTIIAAPAASSAAASVRIRSAAASSRPWTR
ncbi:hypothetical protein D3C72_2285510 [compost metagenome]